MPPVFPVADPAERYGFTSAEVVRELGQPVHGRCLAAGAALQLAADRSRARLTC